MLKVVFFCNSCAVIEFLKNRSPKASNLVQNGNFSNFKPILPAIFVTIAMVKLDKYQTLTLGLFL